MTAVPGILADDVGLPPDEYPAVICSALAFARDRSRTETDEWDTVGSGGVS
jgi:hypothetical protein